MKEGVTDAEYRITNRFGNTGCVNEKICKFPPKKKDEVIIPGVSEPSVRTLRATIPENESQPNFLILV